MKKFFNFNSQSGFTLVELLLYMGIFSILLVILLQLFGTILSTHVESQATSSVDQDGNFILNRLTYDIHNASNITYPLSFPNNFCNWPVDSDCRLEMNNGTYEITSEGNLTLTAGGNTDPLNSLKTTKITDITFTKLVNVNPDSKPSVQIVFTLQSRIIRPGGITQPQTFQTTVAIR